MPLMNILGMSPLFPAACLDIVDCTKHMEAGEKKTGKHIANSSVPHAEELDQKKMCTDLIFFHGASNVALAGELLEVKHPRCTSLRAAEHVLSLFFSDVAETPVVQHLATQCCRVICAVFGSGAMHTPHAMFGGQSTSFDKGRKLGLTRAADTCMAGCFVALHRCLRLKKPLQATVSSASWEEMKNKKKKVATAEQLVKDEVHWASVHLLLRSLHPALRALRLADVSEVFDVVFDVSFALF